jgi:broad specificity phosphatase PhoE
MLPVMTSQLIVARHAETKCFRAGVLNGDPSKPCPLTARGIQQATDLGRRLESTHLDLCITTAFERTRETAAIALSGRDLKHVVEPLLNDPVLGALEGLDVERHREWFEQHAWNEAPAGGESQLEAISRFVAGWRCVLERPEKVVLVIGHAFPLSFALTLASGEEPALRRRYEVEVELAQLRTLDVAVIDKGLKCAQAALTELSITSGQGHRR